MEQTQQVDSPTCGKGLAANSALPAKLAEVLALQAEVLKRHTAALDLTDPDTRGELDAYNKLEHAHRDVSDRLNALSAAMAGYRDLPMGRHDMAVMVDPAGQMEAFERFIAAERELLVLLQEKLEAQEQMLRQFAAARA